MLLLETLTHLLTSPHTPTDPAEVLEKKGKGGATLHYVHYLECECACAPGVACMHGASCARHALPRHHRRHVRPEQQQHRLPPCIRSHAGDKRLDEWVTIDRLSPWSATPHSDAAPLQQPGWVLGVWWWVWWCLKPGMVHARRYAGTAGCPRV